MAKRKVIVSVLKNVEGGIEEIIECYFKTTKVSKIMEPFNWRLIRQIVECRDKGGSVEITFREVGK